MKKYLALFLTFVFWLNLGTLAKANDLVLVSGSVKTIDGIALDGLMMTFIAEGNRATNEVKVDSKGSFLAQLPAGKYSVFIRSVHMVSAKYPCINANFEKTISAGEPPFKVNLPRFKTYEFSFLNEEGTFVPGVRLGIRGFLYEVPENPDIIKPVFSCAYTSVNDSPPLVGGKITWNAFQPYRDELVSNSGGSERAYSYLTGLGQTVVNQLPTQGWSEGKFSVNIKDLPKITVDAKSLKISKNKLSATGKFQEVPAFTGLAPERLFSTAIRISSNGKWTNWIKGTGKASSPDKNGKITYSVNVQFYKGKTIQVALVGRNFTAVNNQVQIKVPK
jgi:hypothetical protein